MIFLEHKRLYSVKGAGSDDGPSIPLGRGGRASARAATSRSSRSCKGVHDALAAAETLAAEGIDAEVIDLRTLRPLDLDTCSIGRADEPAGGGRGGTAHGRLGARAPRRRGRARAARSRRRVDRRHRRDAVPYSPTLEDAYLPDADAIAASVRARLGDARRRRLLKPSRFFQRARLACGLRCRDRRP